MKKALFALIFVHAVSLHAWVTCPAEYVNNREKLSFDKSGPVRYCNCPVGTREELVDDKSPFHYCKKQDVSASESSKNVQPIGAK